MKHSEIFENFIKIATEKGLVSKDAPEKAIKKLETTHRHDALSADDIEKLYQVKIDRPKEMEYENNISDDAHPDTLVISPSYDKINGLVENINERQNILLNIINKTPDGHLTYHKYANQQLLLNLVRLGNELDNKNNYELMSLNDVCLNQIHKESIKKQAFAPALLIIPVLLGALYAQQHLGFVNEGFKINHDKLISEINDLIESNSDWGVGYKYKPEFISDMQNFKNQLSDLHNAVMQSTHIIDQLEKPKNAKELMVISQNPESATVVDAYKSLRTKISNLTPYIKKVIDNFSSEDYKARQIVDKGLLTSLVDKTQLLHGGKGLVSDDFDDVKRALAPYKASLLDIVKTLRGANSIEQKSKQELEQASLEFQNEFGIDAENAPNTPSGSVPVPNKSPETDDIQKQVAELAKQVPGAGGFLT